MSLAVCPSRADLERLARGGLAENDADTIEQHILACGPCLERLKELFRGDDTLTELLRDDPDHDPIGSSPVVENLMKHLESLRLASVPVALGPAGAAEMPTLSPMPPSLRNPDATQGVERPSSGADSSLTDFLAPAQAADELGRLGDYRVLRVLGRGGMGVVYQAEDPKLKRRVAIKAMLPTLAASASAGKRFIREAQAMAAVEHDHIVRIYQVAEDRGVPFLAMEFLRGEPLDQRLQREA